MFSLRVSARALLSVLAAAATLATGGASAQQAGVFPFRWNETPPFDAIQPADVRQALQWTGHLPFAFRGELSDGVQRAVQSWQKAQGLPVTGKLTDDETRDLVRDGLKERDAVGWSVMRDPAVGIAVGVPANHVTFGTPQFNGGTLVYPGGGDIRQVVSVELGSPNCTSLGALYARTTERATAKARGENWFVGQFDRGDRTSFLKAICHSNGMVATEMTVPAELLRKHPGLFPAMAASLAMLRIPDPSVRPRPRIEELPQAPSGFSDEHASRPEPKPKGKSTKAAAIDESGQTPTLKLALREGPELRAEEVFEKVSGAVYVVKSKKGLGSAVAISDTDLLTNCHVVEDLPEVKLVRAKIELQAAVVSRNADADRCVLRTATRLPSWVKVRPFDDIKVGEKAVTVGTPRGLELTVAEGIVSSKRTANQSRYIQTSAPISPGSSGGGLFDAQGHLLGITTFYFKAGQNLNFAIAAEEYAGNREQSAAAP